MTWSRTHLSSPFLSFACVSNKQRPLSSVFHRSVAEQLARSCSDQLVVQLRRSPLFIKLQIKPFSEVPDSKLFTALVGVAGDISLEAQW